MLDLFKRYRLIGTIRLLLDLIFTKSVNLKIRLLRRPFYIRGYQYITWSSGFTSGVGLRIDCFDFGKTPSLTFGDNIEINDYVHIACADSIHIGNNVLIASKVFITDHNHGCYSNSSYVFLTPKKRDIISEPVCIEDDVWLGENVVILPGVNIGKSSVIGASSVVTKSIPPYSVAVGNPARVVKKYCTNTKTWVSL